MRNLYIMRDASVGEIGNENLSKPYEEILIALSQLQQRLLSSPLTTIFALSSPKDSINKIRLPKNNSAGNNLPPENHSLNLLLKTIEFSFTADRERYPINSLINNFFIPAANYFDKGKSK